MIKKIVLIILVFLLCVAWSNDPDVNTTVCSASGDRYSIDIVSDDAGGAIIAWHDSRGGDAGLYMQRLSAAGNALWGYNGKLIFDGPNTHTSSKLTADGSGGVFFGAGVSTVPPGNDYDWHLKRVNSSGDVLWTSARIDTLDNSAYYSKIVPDGAGGALFFWWKENSDNYRTFAQHVDADGNLLWDAGGIPISDIPGNQSPPYAAADGSGGAYIVWEHYSGSPSYYDIFIQRIDGSGNRLWGNDGIKVYDYGSNGNISLLRDRSNGVFVAWTSEDYYNGSYHNDARLQRFNSAGTKLLTDNGKTVFIHPYWGYDGYIDGMIPDNAGGLYLLINSYYWDVCGYDDYDLDLQHVDSSGNTAWGSVGISIDEGTGIRYAGLTAGANGKAIVTGAERTGSNYVLKTQLFNKAGSPQWAAGGLTVSDANFGQLAHLGITSNGAGGAIAAWDFDEVIFAQNICAAGGLGSCAVPIAVIEGNRFGGVAPAEIRFDGSGSYDPDGNVVQWDWDLGDGTSASSPKVTHTYPDIGLYKVSLRVKDNSGYWSKAVKVSVKTFSVDALTAVFDFNRGPVKAKKRGLTSVRASLYDKPLTAEERPIPIDLGLSFETDMGDWLDDLAFDSTTYARPLTADTPGVATVKAVLEGQVLGTAEVAFAWPLPPANLTVNLEILRSLFMGRFDAHLTWTENPAEVFTPAKYRVYRSTDGAAYEMIAEVDAGTFSYVDENLTAANDYSWAVSMVDEAGDESDFLFSNSL